MVNMGTLGNGPLGKHITTALGCSLDPQVVNSVSIMDMSYTELQQRELMVHGILSLKNFNWDVESFADWKKDHGANIAKSDVTEQMRLSEQFIKLLFLLFTL